MSLTFQNIHDHHFSSPLHTLNLFGIKYKTSEAYQVGIKPDFSCMIGEIRYIVYSSNPSFPFSNGISLKTLLKRGYKLYNLKHLI